MSGLWIGTLAHLWQATLVLGAVALLALLLRRAPARYQEGLWTLCLVKLLVPVSLFASMWPALKRFADSAGQQQTIGPAIQTLSQISYPEMLWMPAPETGVGSIPSAVLGAATSLWAVGAVMLVTAWWRRGRDLALETQEPWHAPAAVVERLARAARAADVSLRNIRLTDADVVPCVRRLRKPMVLIPRTLVEHLSADELRAVLIHENAHLERADLWRSLAQGIATHVFFFYPPAWWLARRLRDAAEMACDEAVLAAGVDARTYARALARTVDLGLAPTSTPALSSRPSLLRVRLQRIQDAERYAPMKRHRFAVVVALITVVGLSFTPIAGGAGLRPGAGQLPGEWRPAAELAGLNGIESPVSLRFVNEPLAKVLQQLGEAAGFDVYLMSSADFTRTISVAVANVPAREVLALLAEDALIEYRVVDAATLVVRVRESRREVRRVDLEATPDEIDRAIMNIREANGLLDDPLWRRQLAERGMTEATLREQLAESIAEQRAIQAALVRPTERGPMRVGGDITEPQRIHYVAPEYPELARRARMEGFVILQLVLDKEGNVRDVDVLRGLGLGLDEAATDAVRQWQYTPTLYNGEPVEVALTVNVVFQLIQ